VGERGSRRVVIPGSRRWPEHGSCLPCFSAAPTLACREQSNGRGWPCSARRGSNRGLLSALRRSACGVVSTATQCAPTGSLDRSRHTPLPEAPSVGGGGLHGGLGTAWRAAGATHCAHADRRREVEGRRLVSVVNGSMKFSASLVQTNASMFIMVGARGQAVVVVVVVVVSPEGEGGGVSAKV
jgi:hypothetical protein